MKAFYDVSGHRIVLNSRAKATGLGIEEILDEVKNSVKALDVLSE